MDFFKRKVINSACHYMVSEKQKARDFFIKPLFLFFIFYFLFFIFYFRAWAQSCPATDYDCQISQIQKEIDALTPAHEKNKEELANLKKQLASLSERIKAISFKLGETEIEIKGREEDLEYARLVVEEKADKHYRFLRLYDPITPFLSAKDASQAFREINFRLKAIDEDRKTMNAYGQDLIKLKNDKEILEKNKLSLASLQKQVDERAKFLGAEVEKVETYLATLSAKQQELAALKAGGFQTSVGETPLTFDPCSGPPGLSLIHI